MGTSRCLESQPHFHSVAIVLDVAGDRARSGMRRAVPRFSLVHSLRVPWSMFDPASSS